MCACKISLRENSWCGEAYILWQLYEEAKATPLTALETALRTREAMAQYKTEQIALHAFLLHVQQTQR